MMAADGAVMCVHISHDNRTVAAGDECGGLMLWQMEVVAEE